LYAIITPLKIKYLYHTTRNGSFQAAILLLTTGPADRGRKFRNLTTNPTNPTNPTNFYFDNRACSKTRLVLNQAPGKTGKSPVFPLNSRKLFQKLKFWNSLNPDFYLNSLFLLL
jgi:hypothetical protein